MIHRPSTRTAFTLFLGLWLTIYAAPGRTAEVIRVFAAASLTGAVSELAKTYESRTGVNIRAVFASSSTLARQIISGAPADIYMSANLKWMSEVENRGNIDTNTIISLLTNRLSLIAPSSSISSSNASTVKLSDPHSIEAALSGGRLAMANPDHVPAGMYGKAALRSLGLWEGLKGRIAGAPNAVAALTYVERGETLLGIVYSSDLTGRTRIKGVATFPQSSHPPIIYPAAVIKGRGLPFIQQFFRFLQSDEARAIFSRHGFSRP
jgi:molybdate transport system substrate-binding protein